MKKIYYFIVALISFSMLLVSCENLLEQGEKDQTGDKTEQTDDKTENNFDKEKAVQLVSYYDAFYSQMFVEGVSNDYWMSFLSNGLEMVDDYPYGTGEFVYLEVFPKTVENNFPAGEYPLAEETKDGYAWAGWEYDFGAEMGYGEGLYVIPQGCFVYVFEKDELVETKYIVDGKITVLGNASAAEILVDAVFADGSKATYYYEGKLKFEDYDVEEDEEDEPSSDELSWDYEPTEAGEYTATFDYCDMNNWGDYYGDGTEYVDLTLNGTEWYAIFGLCAPLGSGVEAYGTYTVKDGYTDWTAVPSPGGDADYDYASFLATGLDESGAYSIAYYATTGTVVVSADGVKLDIVSHYGSKIKGEYKGTVTIADKTTAYAPAKGERSKAKSIKLVKATAEDLAYFGVLKNRVRK